MEENALQLIKNVSLILPSRSLILFMPYISQKCQILTDINTTSVGKLDTPPATRNSPNFIHNIERSLWGWPIDIQREGGIFLLLWFIFMCLCPRISFPTYILCKNCQNQGLRYTGLGYLFEESVVRILFFTKKTQKNTKTKIHPCISNG